MIVYTETGHNEMFDDWICSKETMIEHFMNVGS